MTKRIGLFFLLSTILAGCASTPVKLSDLQAGQWKAKALIKDNDQARSFIVNLNFNAKRDETLRMDVTTTLGTGVASLLVNSKEVRYVLFDSKKFYYGTPSPGVMRPILAIPFDPRNLQNILFDIPITGPGWTCDQSGGVIKSCAESGTGIKVTYGKGAHDRRTVLIEHTKASVQINFLSFKAKVEDRKNLFTLEAPEAYQKLHVR